MSDIPICPDCAQGKHTNCDGCSWDNKADTLAACPCDQRGHDAPVADVIDVKVIDRRTGKAVVLRSAELKEAGQSASLFAVTDTTRQDFERILTIVPHYFSVNDCRVLLDLAQIPASARGGLFAAAVKAHLIVPQTIEGYQCRVPSTGPSAHLATVKTYIRTNYSGRAA